MTKRQHRQLEGYGPVVIHRNRAFELVDAEGVEQSYWISELFNEDHVTWAGNLRFSGYEIVWADPQSGPTVITTIPYRSIGEARAKINSGEDFS